MEQLHVNFKRSLILKIFALHKNTGFLIPKVLEVVLCFKYNPTANQSTCISVQLLVSKKTNKQNL